EEIVRRVVSELEFPEPRDVPDYHPDLEGRIDAHGTRTGEAFAEVAEYVRNCVDQQSRVLTADFSAKIQGLREAVVSFLESRGKQNEARDSKITGELAVLKNGIEELLADETAE